jgi:hypothetical protein
MEAAGRQGVGVLLKQNLGCQNRLIMFQNHGKNFKKKTHSISKESGKYSYRSKHKSSVIGSRSDIINKIG